MKKATLSGYLKRKTGLAEVRDFLANSSGSLKAVAPGVSLKFELTNAQVDGLPEAPPVFGQCQEPWRDLRYSSTGTLTFCQAGCLVTTLSSLAGWAGYQTDPQRTAQSLDINGCFKGDLLSHPSRVTRAFRLLTWHGPGDYAYYSPLHGTQETSYINWRARRADLALLETLLKRQPVVVEVDFNPADADVDQHFVLAVHYMPDETGGIADDLVIMDPLSGALTSLLLYFQPSWLYEPALQEGRTTMVARALTGARVWDVETGTTPPPAGPSNPRGVHAAPVPDWPPLADRTWWLNELKAMDIGTILVLTDAAGHQDQKLDRLIDWIAQLKEARITPILRLYQHQQLPDRLAGLYFEMLPELRDAGLLYVQAGWNEPNLEGEYKADWHGRVTYQDDAFLGMLAQNLVADLFRVLDVGLRPCLPPFAPTDRGEFVPNPTASSVEWPKKWFPMLAREGGQRLANAIRDGHVWLATHTSPFDKPLNYEPRRQQPDGSVKIQDMCLRGYEIARDIFVDTFGVLPMIISTEGGAYSPKHLRDLQFEAPYDDAGWGPAVVDVYNYVAEQTSISAICSWTLSDNGVQDPRWLECGWYDAQNKTRSPAIAMKQE